MPHCFMRYVPARDGRGVRPECPDEVGFLLLADVPGLEWGIFDVEPSERWTPQHPVSDELARLIESGKRYPPALALAREELTAVFGGDTPDLRLLEGAYRRALQANLSRQHEAPYVLAPALTDDSVDRTAGEWYWVLEVGGTPPVASWVSDDFRVCEARIHDFDLTGQQLKRLGYVG